MAEPSHRITIVDIDISFGRLVALMIKATFAAIPALIAVWLIFAAIILGFSALLGIPLKSF